MYSRSILRSVCLQYKLLSPHQIAISLQQNPAPISFHQLRFITNGITHQITHRAMAAPTWKRLVRFHPKNDSSKVLIGQPVDENVDVGKAVREGKEVAVDIFSGSSVLDPGSSTGKQAVIDQVLSPVTQLEAGTVRCIGLNYRKHAEEAKMQLPKEPVIFYKPQTSVADPWPATTMLPKQTQEHDDGDYEAELAVIIGKSCKNVSEKDALDYVLGYTASNDISSRTAQLSQSQWGYSKGFDGACPLG